MSTTISVQVFDTATPAVGRIAERAANPIPGLNIAGRAVGNLLKTHFRGKAQTPNKLGGDRTYFWLAVAGSVSAPKQAGRSAVQISVSHPGIMQKIKGGTITAKRAGALTIPVHPKAHGRRASVLARLLGVKLFRVKDVLAAWDKNARKLTIYYALKKSVTQKPDPTALPPIDEMERVVRDNFYRWLQGETQ